jgi:hypothetical protein
VRSTNLKQTLIPNAAERVVRQNITNSLKETLIPTAAGRELRYNITNSLKFLMSIYYVVSLIIRYTQRYLCSKLRYNEGAYFVYHTLV